jgi:hypothetical protein
MKTPLKKLERNYKTMANYLGLMLATFVALQLFVYPNIDTFWAYLGTSWFLMVNFFFYRAAFSDPGHIKSIPDVDFEKLVEKLDPNCLCPNCETSYTTDSRHCYICDRCVGKFDHHCNWINNCIGRGNHRVFYAFILSELLYFVFMDALAITALIEPPLEEPVYTIIEFEHRSTVLFWYYATVYLVLFIASAFMLPMTYLVVIQTGNLLKN